MEINWKEIEKLVKPSPNYEKLVSNILVLFPYGFVRKYYSLNMNKLTTYTTKLLGQDSRQRYMEYMENLNSTFKKMENINVENTLDLVYQLESKAKFEELLTRGSFTPQELIRVLKYLFNWFFPSKTYLREVINKEKDKHIEYVKKLRENDIRFTLDILEFGSTITGRKELSQSSNISEVFLYELVNRADFTRMPYIRGSSINHYFNIGYNSLEKLSKANLETLENEMRSYLEASGVKLSRSFIELDSGIEIAKILPKIVEH